MNRPTPPAGYSYCTPVCHCRNCNRLEAQLRAQSASAVAAVAAAERVIRAAAADPYIVDCIDCGERRPGRPGQRYGTLCHRCEN